MSREAIDTPGVERLLSDGHRHHNSCEFLFLWLPVYSGADMNVFQILSDLFPAAALHIVFRFHVVFDDLSNEIAGLCLEICS
jgi:hypothetical protein